MWNYVHIVILASWGHHLCPWGADIAARKLCGLTMLTVFYWNYREVRSTPYKPSNKTHSNLAQWFLFWGTLDLALRPRGQRTVWLFTPIDHSFPWKNDLSKKIFLMIFDLIIYHHTLNYGSLYWFSPFFTLVVELR